MSSLGAPTLEKVYAEEEKPKGLKKSAASGGLGPILTTVVVLLVVVAVLSTAAALVLAVMVLGDDGSSGSPTSPPVAAPTKPVTSAPTNFPTEAPTAFVCPTVELGVEIRAPGDYIGLIFPACPSEATFEAFTNAAARWNSIITSNRITPFTFGEDLDVNDYCGFPSNGYNIGADDVIDHLTIFAETVDIDGAGGILGAAGPCFIDENFFPVIGGMIFDNADLAGMEQDGTLKFVITHEMGHVLGIGTLFDYVKQGGGAAGSEPSLAADLIFDQDGNAHPQNHGKFLGVAAIGSFSDYSGKEETFVPLEDGRRADGSVFMSPSNGQGSLDGHWKITTFDNELMTFAIDSNEPLHPLSEVSIASLGDMGYAVDLAQADPFSLPSLKQLRSEKKGTKMLDLSHDILNTVKDIKTREDVVAKRKARAKALP